MAAGEELSSAFDLSDLAGDEEVLEARASVDGDLDHLRPGSAEWVAASSLANMLELEVAERD